MPRQINLRQIEAFKAVIEFGTVTRAAEVLNVSQPAMSKHIAHLEADTGLQLFYREMGRLAPTERAMRLYEEINRIFTGVRQVENAVEVIRREEQGLLKIGVIPALAGPLLQRTTMRFLDSNPNVFCSVQSVSAQWIVERIIAREIDVGLVGPAIANPYVTLEPLMPDPLVCIMAKGHPLEAKTIVRAKDIHQVPFVSLHSDTYIGRLTEDMLAAEGVEPEVVLVGDTIPIQCGFAAAGLGISLVPPLLAASFQHELTIRPFKPDIQYNFQICRRTDTRNLHLINLYVEELKSTAADMSIIAAS